jgi:putative ABC transport system permease protein
MVPISYNLRGLAVRKASTIASAFGIGMVVFVLATALMLSAGIQKTLGRSGRPDNAIVLRKGADSEMMSVVEVPTVKLILAGPGVKPAAGGTPLGVGEIIVVIVLDKIGTSGVSNVQVRGVPDDVLAFRPEVRIVAGRPARPGTNEVIIGKRIRGRFAGIELGQSFELRKNKPSTVVGVFEDGGSSFESEVWASVDAVRDAFGRTGVVSSVRVRLTSPSAFDAFQTYIEQDKRLGLQAQIEPVFYEKQSEMTSLFIGMMGSIIAFFFSIGAMIGAMITLYASIADRRREIGVLRALGFSRAAILFCFVLEAVFLALSGGCLGIAGALCMGMVHISLMNFVSFSEVVFSLTPTPAILVTSLVVAAGMGLLGGFLPAVRAARTSPVVAMRG